jgi:hypothetical protein
LRVLDDLLGKRVKCPACATKFLAEAAASPEAAIMTAPVGAAPSAEPAPAAAAANPASAPSAPPAPITIEPEDLVDDPDRAAGGRQRDPEDLEVVAFRPASRQHTDARGSASLDALEEEDEDEPDVSLRFRQRQYQSSGLRVLLAVVLYLLIMAGLGVAAAWYVCSKLPASSGGNQLPVVRPAVGPGQPLRPNNK